MALQHAFACRCTAVSSRVEQDSTGRRAILGLVSLIGADLLLQPPTANANALSTDYVRDTRELAEAIQDLIELDPFDKKRMESLSFFKTESKKWIGAYAKGGSAPGQAAKRMYVAVDAVAGHVNSNGAAPLPKAKVAFIRKTLGEVETLLEQDK